MNQINQVIVTPDWQNLQQEAGQECDALVEDLEKDRKEIESLTNRIEKIMDSGSSFVQPVSNKRKSFLKTIII